MDNTAFKWLAGILLALWLIGGSLFLKSYFCGNNDAEVTESIDTSLGDATGMTVRDGDFSVRAKDFFTFSAGSAALLPVGDGLNTLLSNTADYLKSNADRVLTVTGYYDESEPAPELYPDMGLARANTIKEELENLGVDAAQIVSDSEVADADNLTDGRITNGITFAFAEKSLTDSRLERIRENVVGQPLTLFFESGETEISLSSEQKEIFSDMIYFMDRVPDSNLEIGGHTDSIGDKNDNKRISRKRAESVRDYLSENGIDADRMTAVGYGESKPIGDNNYEPGRRQNRRTEIVLQATATS